jgi:hypothetical protein
MVQTGKCPKCDRVHRQWKYSGLIVHDLRRSAAKALRAAGVAETVIMHVGGWLTPSMFRRYAILDEAEQRAAMQKLIEARQASDCKVAANAPDGRLQAVKLASGKLQ